MPVCGKWTGMSAGRLDGLVDLEQWFHAHGHRLEFVLTNREGWAAVVLPMDGPARETPFLSADAADPLNAAIEARAAFLRATSAGGERGAPGQPAVVTRRS